MLLAIDTSTRYAGVALADGDSVLSSKLWFSKVNHSVELMPAVGQILDGQGVRAGDLEGIAVALGPGGFSALRVGMSVGKGLAMASKIPMVGVGTLDLEAHPYLESGLPVCALLDAGRKETASALFDKSGLRSREDLVGPPEELFESITEPTIFCGEGLEPWRDLIKTRLGPLAVVVGRFSVASRLWSLAILAGQRFAADDADDLATLQPYYLRMPSIGVPKRRDRVPQGS